MNRKIDSPGIIPMGTSRTKTAAWLALWTVLFLFSPTFLHAEEVSPQDMLKKMSASVKKHPGFTARFTQKLSPPNSGEIRSNGDLIFGQGGKMILHYSDPKGQVLLLMGNKMSFYIPQNTQLINKTLKSRTIPDTPALLLEKIGQLDRYFYIRPESPGQKSSGETISLVPKEADRHLALARISIDSKTWLPEKIVFMEVNGVILSISLSDIQTLKTVSPSSFIMKVPPGTTIAQTPEGSH
jgi:outer membrane lipoprotein carrier protein